MTLWEMLRRWLAIRAQRREVAELREQLSWVEENVEFALYRERQLHEQLARAERRLAILEPADELVRRSGAGA